MGAVTISAAVVALIYLANVNGQMYIPQAIKSHYGSSYSSGGGSGYSMGGIKNSISSSGIKTILPSYGGSSYKSSYSKTSYDGGSGSGTGGYMSYGEYGTGNGGGGGSYSSYISSGGHGGMTGGGSHSQYISSGTGGQFDCNPPCQNGGKCVSLLCLCPNEYTGFQCQYRKDICSFKKMKFTGAYKCSDNGEEVTCTVSCPEGSDFEFTPATSYVCRYATGQFLPAKLPQCVLRDKNARWVEGWESSSSSLTGSIYSGIKDSKIVRINSTKIGGGTGYQYGRKTPPKRMPRPGVCFTWGGVHYKTFDGKVFSFGSKCSYVLVRDGVDNTFGIMVQNSKNCVSNPESCYRVIKIFLQDKQYFLKHTDGGTPVFASSEKELTIPLQLPGLRVSKLAHYIVVDFDSIGAKLKWDGQQLVQVEVTESLWNKTEGLCGRIDGEPNNDILTKNKRKPKNIYTLATSWKTDDFGEVCNDIPSDKSSCEKNKVLQLKAITFCKKLLSNPKFAPCHKVMETEVLLEACKWDYCGCTKKDPSECACETMNIYVKECSHKGVTTLQNWRDEETCPIHCTGGQIYKSCGSAEGQLVCGSVAEISSVVEDICIEGCFCPEGTVFHENKCISRDSCPCKMRGKNFASGQTVEKDCNTCTCKGGQWICTELSCGARCSVIGDPHYTTFDGKHYDFMGQCSYYLLKSGNFSIETENVACSGSISKNLGYVYSISTGSPSCTKSAIIKIDGQEVVLKLNQLVTVNGLDIPKLPYRVAGIVIKEVTSTYVQVLLPNGIAVWWDGVARLYIDIPANFDEKTKGLCGTYNNNQKDDFLTPENDIEQAIIPFGNKWKSSDKCNDLPNILITHPCDANFQKKSQAEEACGILKSQLFAECHWRVDPEQFYQDCLYDTCSCGDYKVSKCLCPIVASYAEECSRQGLQIDWRNEIRECGMQCTGGQKYQLCGNSCIRTCADISEKVSCKQQCIEGCNCPEGAALDENGECIPISQCSCRYNDLEFPAGYVDVHLVNGEAQLCTCVNAIWSCTPPSLDDMAKYTEPKEINSRCNITDNFEFTTCKPLQEPTCKNMHSLQAKQSTACQPGCRCKKGYILDTTKMICVKPTECPCHHGGRSYGENEKFHIDCNTCVCQNGKWRCSEKECPGECSAWGDSHFKTFDGKSYDFQGQCDYVLAKGSITTGSFDISIQNVPCGSLGTSCSKSVSIKVGFGNEKELITLTKGKQIPDHATYTHLTIRKKGLFVIIEAPDLGLTLLWDKGTRVYIKLDTRWKSKVKGLCGNYNDNLSDDFQTPSGGISEASARIFGDSWKLQSYCPEAIEIENTCEGRPDRKVWALKKCGLLKSPLFAPCHSAVSIDDYFNRCVFDSCACDQGGDCQCLCTALAAYAQECNNKGIHIKWRSQELCPIQCDERCSIYSPCVSTCPIETCENLITQDKLSKSCDEDACVEGCKVKECPVGYVYYNSSHLECVPRKLCKTICLEINGITYYEGDVIEEDECHSCYCSRGEKICKGQPCSQALDVEKPLPKNDKIQNLVKCKSGWSKWVNQNKISPAGTKTKTKSKPKTVGSVDDIEPIPTILTLNNLEDSSRCEKDQIKKIQCRTVKSHLRWNETGLDVDCDVKDGLVCKSTKDKPCVDFEIRVFCECEKKKPDSPLEDIVLATEPKKCPPGQILADCAIDCDRLCNFYSYKIKESGFCQNGIKCESDCVPINRKPCPSGFVWANNETCVAIQDCMCRAHDGTPVKPGTVHQESECEFCQCVDNYYTCDKSACEVNYITGEKTPEKRTDIIEDIIEEEISNRPIGIVEDFVVKETEIFIPNTGTPPNKCEPDNYINLIQGDSPLPDTAFNASSVSNKHFSPWFARLDNQVSAKSGGSWTPEASTTDQYLEINLGRLEPIYGIIIKGSPLYDEYVTSFKVFYSPDGFKYCYVIDEDKKPYTFRGSVDANTPVKQIFPIPIEAKVVRINPQTWHNEISLRVELIGCADTDIFVTSEIKTTKPKVQTVNDTVTETITSTKVTTVTSTTTTTTKYYKNPMGIGDGMMSDEQIVVSSELDTTYDKTKLKIKGESVWQPLTNSPTEFVQFDFLDKRYVTGIETQGGPDGWVTEYKVEYSPNGKDWSPIVDENLNEQIFLGNFDSTTSQKNYFVRPINTRYIKIVPVKWHKNIQMKVELLGKYKPYPIIAGESRTVTKVTTCKYCPGVPIKETEECLCSPEYWFDGEKCVSRAQCPCIVRNNPYEVGSIFENENCAQCICKLGGVSHCKPKKCGKCEEGLRSTITSTCECSCQPCPEGTVLCPTSNVCIDSDLWCDGIVDCPDDELNCVEIVQPIELIPGYQEEKIVLTEQVVKEEICPILECPPGFKKEEKKPSVTKTFHSYLSPMFSTYRGAKNTAKGGYIGVKSGVKGGVKKPVLRKPSNTTTVIKDSEKCPEFRCVSTKAPPKFINGKKECPPATCPSDYILIYDPDDVKSSKECPRYICNPPPPPEAVCNVTANTISTFDNIELEYDICNHVIARDLIDEEWDITLKKICDKFCSRLLIIRHRDNVIVLNPDLSVEYDGYKYTVDQTKKIGSQTQAFSISRLGNTLLFTSNRYGFWIIWDKQGNLKLGIVRKLINQVDGLCGFFNDNPRDDKRKPDGTPARTTTMFGDSWGLPDQSTCKEKTCPIEMQNKAYQICNKVKDESFEACANILDVQAFISRCTEATCECLQESDSTPTGEDDCRCQALQSFVLDCLSAYPDADLSQWRMQQDCPATCEAPLIYHDCYQQKCEPTCETIGDPNACPKVPHICFPGCYCPPGLVKKGDTCIQASSCRDCECNVLPHLKYVTYDENNFTIDGNCTYIMSRDILVGKKDEHKFQVLVTNEECKNKRDKKCVAKVTILFKKHKLEIFNNFLKYELKLQVDGKVVSDFNALSKWIGVRRTSTKHLKFQLKGAQIEISVYYPSLGVSIKVPSHKYGSKLEGLCGDCNKDPDNDIPTKYPTLEENINKLAVDWLSDAPSDKNICKNQPIKACKELPPESDPCQQLLDPNKFGQCLRILDPDLFLEWCQKDTCDDKPELSCTAIEAYARDCASAGFCVNWRNQVCPAKTCPPGLVYDACGPNCPKTCQNLKEPQKGCPNIPVEGCFCPEGKVLLNNTCVVPNDCEVCDEEGHHPGDKWKKDKCTTCSCEGSTLKCETQQCSGINTICEKGFSAVKVPATNEECCDKYTCVASKLVNPTCEPPQKLSCGPGQTMKLTTKSDGCQQFVCECKPADQCEPLDKSEKALEDGYVKEIDESGCCPVVNYICKKELCPKPSECPQYYNLDKKSVPGKCCSIYECLPPKDKCIYEAQYTAAKIGGERLRTKYEKQQLIKDLNETWNDGPCRECKCIKTSADALIAACTQTECQSIESSRDFSDYILESRPVFEECCPTIKRTACKHLGNIYNVGEKWTTDEDFCTSLECKETPEGIQKEVLVTSCDSNCELGYEYEPAPKASKKCCGTCKPTACVVDGILHKVDEQWKSADHCTNYFCVYVNGTAQIQAFLVNCPETPKDYDENYVYDTIPVEGECCKKFIPKACKIGDQIYKDGETAPSPDGDKCKQITCTKNEKGELIKQTNIETCKTDCPKGFDYKPYDDKCCGECIPIACVVGEDLKLPGEQWLSQDTCTHYTCEKIGEQLTVSGQQESCPSVDDCAEENIYVKGCCKHCNLTSASQILNSCSPVALDLEKTTELFKAKHPSHGLCINKKPIEGFTECVGSCHSATSYNPIVGNIESVCECCKGIKMKPIEIELVCEDDFVWSKKLSVPISCKCQGCNAGIKTG